ncbi:RraA family protein [Consotaella salsifontis]|uniref:Putative 4-hydroxy-4-methyl-2-oxoglutarate aldolase n=1 Tax=Consotaella salsifontis TaxID=1365950 RepID=A0A1T4TAF6_9HYPH|nr:RraA family protein [Consotaella salsifontis]SKA37383.1 Regulator of RNase E activity RraA [Consotaella salsifontis]
MSEPNIKNRPAAGSAVDPFHIRKYFEPVRVADVADAMDGIGYFNIGLVSQEIRPLWLGMKFWGVAFTLRCVPANKPMWKLNTTEDVVNAHGIWFDKTGNATAGFHEQLQPGHVVVTDVGSTADVGFWGSENSLGAVTRGAVGIVTNGQCRDTGEVTLQKTPVCARGRGRTIIPGRIETVECQTPIGIGGAQVRPGDIVGCDDDGLIVVPIEVAKEVALHARAVLLADMKARRRRYDQAGMAPDASVDIEAVERHYAALEG